MEAMAETTVGRKKSDKGPRVIGLNIKGTAEWAEWARRGAKAVGMPLSVAVDQALRRFYKANGFQEAPPER